MKYIVKAWRDAVSLFCAGWGLGAGRGRGDAYCYDAATHEELSAAESIYYPVHYYDDCDEADESVDACRY